MVDGFSYHFYNLANQDFTSKTITNWFEILHVSRMGLYATVSKKSCLYSVPVKSTNFSPRALSKISLSDPWFDGHFWSEKLCSFSMKLGTYHNYNLNLSFMKLIFLYLLWIWSYERFTKRFKKRFSKQSLSSASM